MHYYIDGYNLLFRLNPNHTSLKEEREYLISELSKELFFLKLDATLVFDSMHTLHEETLSYLNDLRIIYTKQGESADEWIVNTLQEQTTPSQCTVVSSDKKLTKSILLLGGKVLAIDTFLSWLQRRLKNKKHPPKIVQKQIPTKEKITIKTTPEKGSLDYYLEIFQKEAPLLTESKTLEIQPKKKARVLSKEPLSDHDRWLQLFEEKLSKQYPKK